MKIWRVAVRTMSLVRAVYAAPLLLMVVLVSPTLAQNIVVVQKDKMFSQAEITLKVGESVEFRNDDDTAHSVISFTPGHEFELKLQRPGEGQAIAFDKPGRIEVECDIHPKMLLIINVQ